MNELYKDKFFYEVIRTGPNEFRLIGPLNNIRYTESDQNPNQYPYVQLINGMLNQAFTKDEIYVTTTPLVGSNSKLYERVLNENQ